MKIAFFSSLAKNTGCWRKLGYFACALKKKNVDVVIYEPLPKMPFFMDFLLSIPLNLVRVLACKCDVLFGAKPFLHITLPFFLRKCLTKNFTIVDVDDLDYEYRKGILRNLIFFSQTSFASRMDMVTYHNPALVEPLENVFRVESSKLYRLKQGVDFDVFNSARPYDSHDTRRLKELYGLSKNDEILLYTAHLNAACCLDGVLRVFHLVKQKKENAKLLVIGGGELESHYRRMAIRMGLTDSVLFTGYLEPIDVAAHIELGDIALVYYDDADANRYRCSMKLRELLGMGRIVVCNKTDDTAVFAEYLLTTDSDAGIMSEAVLNAMANKEKFRDMAEKGRAFVLENFDWSKIAGAFLSELKTNRLCLKNQI